MSDVVATSGAPWWRRFRAPAPSAPVMLRASGRVAPATLWLVLAAITTVVFVAAIGRGAYPIPAFNVVDILLSPLGIDLGASSSDQQTAVLWSIRLPRVLLAMAVGAGLAVSGALLQGLFRNPLADPGLIGVTSGAALAAAAVIVLGGAALPGSSPGWANSVLPLAAFGGGVAVVLIVQRIATRDGITSVAAMLLTGVAMSALAAAGIGLLIYVANDVQLRAFNFWTLGSLGSANWEIVAMVAPAIAIALAGSRILAPQLNALVLGEAEAQHLGVDTQRLKNIVVLLALIAVGASVAFCGMIGFIGLVAPHLVRLLTGPDHRTLLPASALLGAALTTAADLVARTIVPPAELPIGVLTALLGVPFFLILLRRQRGQWSA